MSLSANSLRSTGRTAVTRDAADARRVLTPAAVDFLVSLHDRFDGALRGLMQARADRQARYDAGELPDFPAETTSVRDGVWTAAPVPEALRDRRVEITGPVDRKMMINALNSGAKVFMADFEDASSPTFENMISGQANMQDYAAGSLDHTDPVSGKAYRLKDETALMIVRPRGLHMRENHLLVDGQPIAASLFDFGLHMFHNGAALAARGIGPFYYLPKMQAYQEARLWNAVFEHAQDALGIPRGTVKATVLIETLPAAFEMDEIIWELREHIAGLNCGRWDYIFSYIKTLRAHAAYTLPDRGAVTMDRAFLCAYAARLVQVCHRRGVHAMGGMAAQIPIKNDETANAAAFDKVRADKLREVRAGHDGTWVAHPDLVPVAREVFDAEMPLCHQIAKPRTHAKVTREMLLKPHTGEVTEAGVRANVSVGIEYIAAWLGGRGAVPLHNLMEDAATAEISRSQIWQWVRHGAEVVTEAGTRRLDAAWAEAILAEETARILARIGETRYRAGHFAEATRIFRETALSEVLPDFLTTPAYAALCAGE